MNARLNKTKPWWLILAGMAFAGLCQAAPFQGTDTSGTRGETVEVALIDEAVASLESFTVKASYDPAYLDFTNALAGDLTAGFLALAGTPYDDGLLKAVDVNVAGPIILSGGPGSILKLAFQILPGSPSGITLVSFESIDTDYDIPKTTGSVDVIGQALPEPGSFILLASGLLLMVNRRFV